MTSHFYAVMKGLHITLFDTFYIFSLSFLLHKTVWGGNYLSHKRCHPETTTWKTSTSFIIIITSSEGEGRRGSGYFFWSTWICFNSRLSNFYHYKKLTIWKLSFSPAPEKLFNSIQKVLAGFVHWKKTRCKSLHWTKAVIAIAQFYSERIIVRGQ